MKQEHILTKISLGIDITAICVLLLYFIAVAPFPPVTGFGGALILSPPLFGIFGLITAIVGQKKKKSNLGVILMVVNIIFLCWWPMVWVGGTLLFGP